PFGDSARWRPGTVAASATWRASEAGFGLPAVVAGGRSAGLGGAAARRARAGAGRGGGAGARRRRAGRAAGGGGRSRLARWAAWLGRGSARSFGRGARLGGPRVLGHGGRDAGRSSGRDRRRSQRRLGQ